MKISTKGRYGLRAMLDLAIHTSSGSHVSLSSIAENQDVSVSYLEQVFSALRKSGLVKSIKGAQGGYTLGDDPGNITVGSILRALEGEMKVVEEDDTNPYDNMQLCIKKNVWDRMDYCINSIIDSITLEDMIEEYNKLNGKNNYMYYI
ncbi:MAG: RrF2 family transcriptional regulator [Caldicoprobacterales bacterium]|jgi:Rrf2 family cysteine metabolism transcriptional repressor|nr:Rrf2 family transcriptional regulator [Clostridiales bacterium]